ncbi:MAG: glycosyltransferase family 4 protein [Leptolyngbyaceae cyanobacterium]
MRVAILRRIPKASVSMDVYADRLVSGLKTVRPDWTILECYPMVTSKDASFFRRFEGVRKYYERYWRYPARLDQFEADIFHVIDHGDGYLNARLRRAQRPSVVTCHDLINLIRPDTFKGRARFPLISMAAWRRGVEGMHQANHIITVSSQTKQDVIQQMGIPSQRITVVPNGVNAIFQRLAPDEIQAARQHYGLTKDHLCLLNVGSNNARKNIATILEVVSLLKQQGVAVYFWKVGADFTVDQAEIIRAKGLEDCVSYLGKPDEETLVKLYNAADILVAPSTYEGFGLTVLEAMACGTAVVTSNVTSLPEVAGDAALFVDPMDKDAIVEAILKLHTNLSLRDQLIQKGLERVKAFTWERTAEQVVKVYEEVLAQK